MGFWRSMDDRVKRMTVTDIGLVKGSVFFFTIIIVKIFPQLLGLDYALLAALVIACGAKPLYVFWMKR